MWSPVHLNISSRCDNGSPIARCKHAMCVTQDGHIYVYGGRSANLPLKDLWRFDAGQNQWQLVTCKGQHPPNLQEHTIVHWNNALYVFGGEIGFSSNGETPLWILDLTTCSWRKNSSGPQSISSGMTPTGRRGHSAVIYGDAMHIYGGYQDLRGSTSELWTFDLLTEQWHLMSGSVTSNDVPPPRHTHTAVVHHSSMWIYGGMTDLQDRSDFWKWHFSSKCWHRIKANKGPGDLHAHSAIKAYNSMFIFGGERSGNLLAELWKFNFDSEVWERINAEGVIPNCRCRHVAIANPFLNISTEAEESNNKIVRLSSKSNISSSQNQCKALVPPKSISMCFGQPTDTPLHQNGKALKQFKFRVHPMSALCSGRSATLSDDDDDINDCITDENYDKNNVMHLNHRNNQVTLRKSLKDKISHSRLVRSISSSSYNVLTHQTDCSADELKSEMERLVEESTPHATRQHTIVPNKSDGNYHRLKNRSKMLKSISCNAVLESDSESSTPQHHCSNSPETTEILQTQSVGATLLDDEVNNTIWSKRHTVHESMSYYSLCFPSPPHSKSGSESSNNSSDNNAVIRPTHQRLSTFSFDRTLDEFDEDIENVNITKKNSVSPDSIKENVSKTLNQLNDSNAKIVMVSPEDGRPKSSGYNSSSTLYTPSIESRGISRSASHSLGYHSYADESMYDPRDFAGVLQQNNQSIAIPRRVPIRHPKNNALIELKNLNANRNQIGIGVNDIPLISSKLLKEKRARSLDRASTRSSITPNCDTSRMAWQPNINVIKEVVVPGSPASRKWSYSPAKSKLHQHHWQLCMYIFGGREQGLTGVYKQPMSIWKLYI